MRYVSTVSVFNFDKVSALKVGQWVQDAQGTRGQYLGTTDAKVTVIRWQNDKFAKRDAVNNMHLRRFAKTYGSK